MIYQGLAGIFLSARAVMGRKRRFAKSRRNCQWNLGDCKGYFIKAVKIATLDREANQRRWGMNAKELAEMLLQYPDFEVSYMSFNQKQEMFIYYSIIGMDVGHSDKIINLQGDEI
jgi:hypothetical protein